MSLEAVLLLIAWLVTAAMLIIFVPRQKIREAHVIFLSKQLMTWLFGLLVAEYDLIRYPVRLFPYANKADFTFEFFVYPAIAVFFNLWYPVGTHIWRKLLHYVSYCTAITVIEVIVERYTKIIDYVHWTWYLTWITLCITFYLSRIYYVWFFRLKGQEKKSKL